MASDRYFHQEYLATNQKSLRLPAQTVVLMVLVTLTFNICSICCIKCRNFHAKFHRNPSRVNGDMAAVKVSKIIGPINVCTNFEINRYKID